jgi:hypothetical protein
MYRWFPSILKVVTIIEPETLLRWYRAGFRCYWRWKSRPRRGRPQIEIELRALIRQMSTDNQLWGAPRIHDELLSLGLASRNQRSPRTWSSDAGRPEVAHLSAQSRARHCRNGFVRGPDHWLQTTLRLHDCAA